VETSLDFRKKMYRLVDLFLNPLVTNVGDLLLVTIKQTLELNNVIKLLSIILLIGKIFPFKTQDKRTSKMCFLLPFGNFRQRDLSFSCITWECLLVDLTFFDAIGVISFERSTLQITCLDALLSRFQFLFF
jgi:hypothetical protein